MDYLHALATFREIRERQGQGNKGARSPQGYDGEEDEARAAELAFASGWHSVEGS